ncbi:hypothetical protein CTEN210_09259 [Chaetoceros tenuissimus]|uniref:Uncharacterized protein n=1 Tax=Chaetoceros tenuissimus TaxID=426638 RepID=A0AAD3CVL1_9STRA|nr:hypothetical protein CTEN210_09259 [Chaetoceros tenuissimus]
MDNKNEKETDVEPRELLDSKKRSIENTNDENETENDTKRQHVSNDKGTELGEAAKMEKSSCSTKEDNFCDVAQDMKLDSGTRLEVQWELHSDQDNTTTIRWWGGTLLPHDGRTYTFDDESGDKVTVPIRVIDYDPFEEGGFMDRSLEDVAFLTDHTLQNMASNSSSYWRLEKDNWEPSVDIDDYSKKMLKDHDTKLRLSEVVSQSVVAGESKETLVQNLLNEVLKSSIQRTGLNDKMKALPASVQATLAERIASSYKAFGDKLVEQLEESDEITEEHINKIAQSMPKPGL